MVAKNTWQDAEDQFLRTCVKRGLSNKQLVIAFQGKFGPEKRSDSAIKKRRSEVCGDIPVLKQQTHFRPELLEPDEKVHVKTYDNESIAQVHVMASRSIKNPEMLFEQSGLDTEKWELVPGEHQVKKWDVPMRIKEEAVVVPCWYVAIRVRLKYEFSSLPMPIVFDIPQRKKNIVPLRKAITTSVHWSDIHFPHEDAACIEILYQILDDLDNVEFVADQGDTLDCQEISSYPKNPLTRVSLKDEVLMGAKHFATVTELTPNAQRVWCEGNHEDRLRRLIWGLADSRQAGEILGLDSVREALEWKSLLGLESLDWQMVRYPKHHLLHNRLVICHGETARQVSGQSAKAELLKYSKSGLSGHTHRVEYYGERTYDGSIGWWGLGCLCDIANVQYTNHPNWQQGFAVVNWSPDKKTYSVERVRIHDGKAIFRGKTYG
jgi:hypothetical protein